MIMYVFDGFALSFYKVIKAIVSHPADRFVVIRPDHGAIHNNWCDKAQ